MKVVVPVRAVIADAGFLDGVPIQDAGEDIRVVQGFGVVDAARSLYIRGLPSLEVPGDSADVLETDMPVLAAAIMDNTKDVRVAFFGIYVMEILEVTRASNRRSSTTDVQALSNLVYSEASISPII